jgi:hypothetical protein
VPDIKEVPVQIASLRAAVPMLALALLGCGSGFGDVHGKVTYKARPLAAGSVMFLASDGRPYDGAIDLAGNYAIDRVPIGPARIAVNCLTPIARDVAGDAPKSDSRTGPVDEAKARAGSAIPLRYGDFSASKLSVTIEPGRRRHDIELGD